MKTTLTLTLVSTDVVWSCDSSDRIQPKSCSCVPGTCDVLMPFCKRGMMMMLLATGIQMHSRSELVIVQEADWTELAEFFNEKAPDNVKKTVKTQAGHSCLARVRNHMFVLLVFV